ARRGDAGVESNARLTASTAVILVVLLAVEGVTVLRIHALLTLHVFVGMLLVPLVAVKIGSTTWRFARYYRGNSAYRRKGPPPAVLRLLGPFVVATTVVMFASGIVLLVGPANWHSQLLFVHQASFVAWLVAMTAHVLGHARDTVRLAPLDWARRNRNDVRGGTTRQAALVLSMIVGVVLASVTIGQISHYLQGQRFR
nr:hypothetical protein [Actinomycetota bacterium]